MITKHSTVRHIRLSAKVGPRRQRIQRGWWWDFCNTSTLVNSVDQSEFTHHRGELDLPSRPVCSSPHTCSYQSLYLLDWRFWFWSSSDTSRAPHELDTWLCWLVLGHRSESRRCSASDSPRIDTPAVHRCRSRSQPTDSRLWSLAELCQKEEENIIIIRFLNMKQNFPLPLSFRITNHYGP